MRRILVIVFITLVLCSICTLLPIVMAIDVAENSPNAKANDGESIPKPEENKDGDPALADATRTTAGITEKAAKQDTTKEKDVELAVDSTSTSNRDDSKQKTSESSSTANHKNLPVEAESANITGNKPMKDDAVEVVPPGIEGGEKQESHSASPITVVEERKPSGGIVELESPDELKRIVLEKKESASNAAAAAASAASAASAANVASSTGTGGGPLPGAPTAPATAVVPAGVNLTAASEKTNRTLAGFNYASLDAGAMIMSNNAEAQGVGNLLIGDPDKYSLSPCSAQQWFVISLSEEILVTTVEVSNFERYSSSAKAFQLWGAHKFPAATEEWYLLGEFERPTHRGTESFALAQPSWARYIKFEVVSKHGNEVYCTLSKVRVFGQTTLETLREDLAISQLHIEAVRTTISDHQLSTQSGGAPSSPMVTVEAGSVEGCDLNVDIGQQQQGAVPEIAAASSPETAISTVASPSTGESTALPISPQTSNSSAPPQDKEEQQNSLNQSPHNIPASSESPSQDALTLSLVTGKPSPASVDNIFKTLMDKVKGVEIDVSVLNACLETNNEKVKVALEFLDKGLKDLKEELSVLGKRQDDEERVKLLEDEVKALSRRQASLESMCFFAMFLAFVAIMRARALSS